MRSQRRDQHVGQPRLVVHRDDAGHARDREPRRLRAALAIAVFDGEHVTLAARRQQPGDGRRVGNGLSLEPGDHVAGHEACCGGAAARQHAGDCRARQVEGVGEHDAERRPVELRQGVERGHGARHRRAGAEIDLDHVGDGASAREDRQQEVVLVAIECRTQPHLGHGLHAEFVGELRRQLAQVRRRVAVRDVGVGLAIERVREPAVLHGGPTRGGRVRERWRPEQGAINGESALHLDAPIGAGIGSRRPCAAIALWPDDVEDGNHGAQARHDRQRLPHRHRHDLDVASARCPHVDAVLTGTQFEGQRHLAPGFLVDRHRRASRRLDAHRADGLVEYHGVEGVVGEIRHRPPLVHAHVAGLPERDLECADRHVGQDELGRELRRRTPLRDLPLPRVARRPRRRAAAGGAVDDHVDIRG